MLIYFDAESKQTVVRTCCRPGRGGYLVVGPTEGIFAMLGSLTKHKTWLYQNRPDRVGRGIRGVVDVGFRPGELLPFYLDETDEQIAGAERCPAEAGGDPTDDKALREAFRLVHTIKGRRWSWASARSRT